MKAPSLKKIFESKWMDRIHGGKADKKKPSDFDQKELKRGMKHELEHTDDKKLAMEIAMDHLSEDPHYYEKLSQVEEAADETDWETSLGLLPGQKLAQDRERREKQSADSKSQLSKDRLSAIASRSQASQGGKVPLTRKQELGQDPGVYIKQLLSKQPLNRAEILRALSKARGQETFDIKKTLADVNRYYPGFKFDDFLNKVAVKDDKGAYKLK